MLLWIGILVTMQVPIEAPRVYGPNLGLQVAWPSSWAMGSLSMAPGVDVSATIMEPSLVRIYPC